MAADPVVLVAERPGRLDGFILAACPTLSRRLVRRLIDDGAVRVDGRRAARGARIARGAHVTLPPIALEPEPDLPVSVRYVDEDIVVVDKPGGMPGHALDPRQRGTVAAFLAARFPETASVGDPLSSGLAHRLDTGTSGLQMAARSGGAFARLRDAFRAGEVTKRYLAIVSGTPPARAVIETPLAHDPRDRRRMIAATAGRRAWPARTEVTLCQTGAGVALVTATLRSGVTHQVRAHLAQLGHPVLGDVRYDGPDAGLPAGRHALHASALEPAGRLAGLPRFESELPADLRALLEAGDRR
jgi:23S rRNA pseudouridine1911/1915/1917 synthase